MLFSLGNFFNVLSILLLITSISAGIITALSRLYDFRITRQITYIRKYYYSNKNKSLPKYKYEIISNNFKKFWSLIWKAILILVYYKTYTFEEDDILTIPENKILQEQFIKLRKDSYILGILSWASLKIQFRTLLVSLILYAISLIF